jgi:glycosyltransferase involved in cell wall biosynthesis
LVHAAFSLGDLIRTRGPVAGTLRYATTERLLATLRPDAVITPSRATAEAVRRFVRAPVRVVGAGADHVPDGPDPDGSTGQIVFVGRLVPSKGVRDAVQAVAAVRRRVPSAELLVIGTGPEERRLHPWVRHAPSLDDERLDQEIRRSAAVVLPSVQEGWGLVLCEAAARGVPYVAYDIPAVREQHGVLEGGVLVPVGDLAALAKALESVVTDPDLRGRLGRTGRERARSRLRWADVAAQTERVIAEVLEGAG